MRIQLRVFLVMALLVGVFAQSPGPLAPLSRAAFAAPVGGDAITVWSAHAGVAAMNACIAPLDDPFHESRMYAMMHLAIHDALNAVDRRFQPYAFDKRAEPGASPDAAVAAVASDVLVPLLSQLPRELPFITQSCIDAGVSSVEAAYTAALATLPDAPAKRRELPWDRPQRRRFSESRGWCRWTISELQLPAGERAWQVPVHAGIPVRRLRGLGKGHAFRAAGQHSVPSRAALRGDRQELHG